MEKFSEIVFAALPYALIFIAIVGVLILILKLRLRHIENQPKEVEGDGTADNGRE